MDKKEFKIGETFQCGLVKLKVDTPESGLCKGCFFGPDKIPSKYYKGEYPLINDVVRYVQDKHPVGSLFDDDETFTSCMSYYGLCE